MLKPETHVSRCSGSARTIHTPGPGADHCLRYDPRDEAFEKEKQRKAETDFFLKAFLDIEAIEPCWTVLFMDPDPIKEWIPV